ncbi:hypothetical protein EH165_02440 [Nakamurella antarctica]|uniref:DUF7224 domain-containing protein n=1 Tax=Nakamurella antarctica TaxID=1902245 RepID=A0A3G8ZIM6_9ACTN|nr:hypothetical protein [Nakamurella antarctica]AZI57183.1 hypothetical protein EH165_02440 [Nakamurella antarctica]
MSPRFSGWFLVIRRNCIKVGAGIALLFAVLAVLVIVDPGTYNVYATAGTGAASFTINILGPIAAACGAYEAHRLQCARLLLTVRVRSRAVVVLWQLGPIVVGMFLVFLICTQLVGVLSDLGFYIPDVAVALSALAGLVIYTGIGAILGAVLVPAIAVPAALVGVYLWLAFSPTSELLWLRHLTGVSFDCCVNEFELDGAVLAATVLLAAATVFAACTVVGGRFAPKGLVSAVVAVIAALLVAVQLVDHLGPAPVAPRSTAMVCAGEHPRVCLWPEHAAEIDATVLMATAISYEFKEAGIQLPATASEAIADPETTWPFAVHPLDMSESALRRRLVMGLIPADTCAGVRGLTTPDITLMAWVMLKAGMSREDLDSNPMVDQLVADQLKIIDAMSPTERGDWWRTARSAPQTCVQ